MKRPTDPHDARIAGMATTYDLLLTCIPTVNNPKGNPELAENLLAILRGDEPPDARFQEVVDKVFPAPDPEDVPGEEPLQGPAEE